MNKHFSNRGLLRSQQKGITRIDDQTQDAFLNQATLASMFYEQAARRGNQTAISFKNEKLTYEELNRLSNQVAYLLCQIGIQSGHVVMILLDRSIEAYIAILGILKAGAAYLPVDPATPLERVHAILTQSHVRAVLTKSRFLSRIEAQGVNCIVTLDELKPFQKAKKRSGKVFEREDIALYPDGDLPLRSRTTDLAYIIYTSGSTGTPKGVMIEQRSVVNLAFWAQKTFGLSHQSHVAQNYSIAFDASVQEIFSAWASGAALYPIPEDIQINPSLFVLWLKDHAISYWDTIPSLWYQVVHFVASQPDEKSIAFPQLEVLVLGGEVLHADQIQEWIKRVTHAHKIFNVYGPTEATVTTTYYQTAPNEKRSFVAIGQPVDNAEVYILDENLHQCMPNTEGEIWIGGIGLARGYLHAEELTHSSFRSVDLPGKGERRLYRTGDFGKLLFDGNLEFVGRRDEQVKVRGYRIELAEIEIALRSYSGVRDAVVLVKDEVDSRKIVAYYTSTNEENFTNEIREFLKGKIPQYMVPHYFIRLTAMPLTANNKVDKAALLQFANDRDIRQDDVYQEPATKTEKLLAEIWKEVLHLEKIGVHDNFFALGGDSILSIMIRNRCELEGIRLKTVDLFHHSTIQTLARYIDDHLHELQLKDMYAPSQHIPAIVLSPGEQKRLPSNVNVILPLLPFQYGMLYESAKYAHAPQRLYRCEGTIDLHAFERAINVLIQRHEALRTIFRADITSQPVQIILSHANYQLSSKDLSGQSWQEQEASIEQEAKKEREQGFEPEQWPLFHFTVYKRSETQFDILWTAHHLIIDSWSTALCFKELSHVYAALVTQKFHPLPQPKMNFSDYAVHFLQKDYEGGRVFWQEYLADMQPMTFPTDLLQEHEGKQAEEISVLLDKKSSARLAECAQQNEATLSMTCLAAYCLLLKHVCQRDDIVIGIPISARSEGAEEGMSIVGNLVQTLPLRVNAHGATTVQMALDLVKKSLLDIQPHAFLGFTGITSLVGKDIQTLFVFEDDSSTADANVKASFHTFKITALIRNEQHGLPLTVICYTNSQGCLACRFEYMATLFKRETIEVWAKCYVAICREFTQVGKER